MKKYIWIIPLIAFISMVIAIFWIIIPYEEAERDLVEQLEIEELKRENKMLLQANDQLDDKIILLEQITDSLTTLIGEDQKHIEYLNASKDESIRNIDGFTDDELYQYFANFSTRGTSDKR